MITTESKWRCFAEGLTCRMALSPSGPTEALKTRALGWSTWEELPTGLLVMTVWVLPSIPSFLTESHTRLVIKMWPWWKSKHPLSESKALFFFSSEKCVENKGRKASGKRKVLVVESISRCRQAVVSSLNSESSQASQSLGQGSTLQEGQTVTSKTPHKPW